MVFTANAGLVFNKKVILSRFKHPERQGEEKFFEEWFLDHGYEVLSPENYFEGAGDCLLSKANTPRFFCGHGFRSDKNILVIGGTGSFIILKMPPQLSQRFVLIEMFSQNLINSPSLKFLLPYFWSKI